MPLADGGFSLLCPYHPEKNGWLLKVPINYSIGESIGKIDNTEQFSVSDTVKLSLHMSGFVQFSRGAKKPIVSGYSEVLQKPKGVGVKSPVPVEVTTGPLCGFTAQGLEKFKPLTNEKAEVFLRNDLWYHPKYPPDSDAYHVEIFMLPIARANAADLVDGKRLAKMQLPFYARFKFPHTLRIIELPGLWFCLGVIICPQPMDDSIDSGYKLSSPSIGEPGQQKFAISAWYPRPPMLKDFPSTSLDYVPLEAVPKDSPS